MEMLKHYLINYVCFQTRKFYRSSNQGIVTLFTICISRDVGFLLYQVRSKPWEGVWYVLTFVFFFFFWKIEHFFFLQIYISLYKSIIPSKLPSPDLWRSQSTPPFSIFDLNIQIVFYCIKHFIQQIEQVFFSPRPNTIKLLSIS